MWAVTAPEMIEMAGGVNCFGDKETGSFRLDWDAVVESQPEMIILMLWAIRCSARWRMCPSWGRSQAGTTCQRYDITRFRHRRWCLHQPLRTTLSTGLRNHR